MIPSALDTPIPSTEAEKKARMKYVFEKAAEISKAVNVELPSRLNFEVEGVQYPSVFYKKKNYAAIMWENPDAPKSGVKTKGLVAVRNDKSALLKRTSTEILNLSVNENNPHGAFDYLKGVVFDLMNNRLPLTDFVFNITLKDMNPKSISPHVHLAKRKAEIGQPYVLGTKVSYIVCKGFDSLSESAQTLEDIQASNGALQVDIEWYFQKQIIIPILPLMQPFFEGGEKTLISILKNQFNKQNNLYTSFGLEQPRIELITSTSKRKQTTNTTQKKKMKNGSMLTFFK